MTPTPDPRAEAVAEFMHGFAHGGYGPWDQPGGTKHRQLDTALAARFLAALRSPDTETMGDGYWDDPNFGESTIVYPDGTETLPDTETAGEP